MKTLNKLMSYLVILALILPTSLVPSVANAVTATTVFSDGFGTGSSNTILTGGWSEGGNSGDDAEFRNGGTGNDSDSPDGGRFAVMFGEGGYICRTVNTSGYNNVSLSYYWRGDDDSGSSSDNALVEVKPTGPGVTCSNSTGWTNLADHDMRNDSNWTFQSAITNPIMNNSSFLLRFRTSTNDGNENFRVDGISLTGTQMVENTLALCTDSIDNDGDGQTDLVDSDCNSFKPKLTVTKVVVNDNDGTKVVADFSLFVDGNSVTSGTENVYSVGAHTVSETADSNYTGTITGDCASNGSITLSAGDVKSCTITNDDKAPTPINGGWTSWSPATCPTAPGSPASTLNRTCTNPSPANGGTDCEGSSVQECPAVPALPPQCTPNNEQVIVSDTTTMVGETPAVALTFIHPAWTANISGATWIWATDPVESPTDDADITKTFTKTFTISGNPTSGKLDIATDNSYTVKVNGTEVPVVFDQDNFQSTTQDSYDIKSLLVTGTNTIEISVTNWEVGQSADPTANPAGLLYKLTINSETCPEVPTTATINAKKIVCDSESDLPNWGAGDSTMQEITSNTANRYLSIHPNCHLADWTFEYAPDGTSNPGDNIGVAGGAWTPFSGTVSIPASSKVWVREQANPDYIPFSGDTSSEGGWDAISAEMYCSKDTLNYDNYDYIAPLEAGKTYNCLAFNVLKKAPEPTTTSVKMCKFDDKQNPLSGWTLMLKGEKVQEGLSVPTNISTGIDSNSLTAGTSYLALSSGTWTNQGGANPVDTEYSTTDSWLTHMDGYTGYQTDILELQINNQFDPNSNWGAYNSLHKYAQSFIPSITGGANFRIFDGTGTVQNEGWFGDNNGNLNVDIYKGYAGITGEDGCVTFTDVPYGSYTADELSQDNWSNTSGLGDVSVNADTNTINVVNHDNTAPAPVCDPQVELIKNGSFENNVVSNPEKWNIFASGTVGLDWLVEWFGGNTTYNDATRPEVANLELHNGVNGWLPSVGNQYAELDTDWVGPTNPLNGEPASVAISQDIPTIPGKEYKLTFDFSARPDTSDSENVLEVLHNGLLDMTAGPTIGSTNTIWTPKSLTFIATTTNTRITFRDAGTPNDSLGTFVDNVSLKCQIPDENPPIEEETDVCSNISGMQTTIPEGKELKDGLCVDIENHEDDTPNPERISTPGGNGPINYGFVAPGGNPGGQVLGASISKDDSGLSCTPYLTTYMRMGKKNNVDEVKKLQTFLNEYLGLNLPITGFFGLSTKNAVEQFQIKENTDVLGPWVKAGLYDNDKKPTGYVYKTTLRKINLIKCNTLDIPIPQLP